MTDTKATGERPRVLVAYASKHGSTKEIAEAIAAQLTDDGLSVDCISAEEVQSVEAYGAVVLGSAVYMKRWQKEARHLLKHQAAKLAERPLWVFSSGPCGKSPDPTWAEPSHVIDRVEHLGARDHVVFGGRLPAEPSNFIEKAMVRDTPPEQADLRDWDAIRAWAQSISGELLGASVPQSAGRA